MEIRSAIHSMPFGMARPAGSTPPGSADASNSELKRDDVSTVEASAAEADGNDQHSEAVASEFTLGPEDLQDLQLLKQRDLEVRAHEQAHVAAGGRYVTSSASYDYQTGPDGRRYAIGGEVGIDTSSVSGDPAATLAKARAVRRAALAPAEPSAQDLRVAASASTMETGALSDLRALARLQREEMVEEATSKGDAGALEETRSGEQAGKNQAGQERTEPLEPMTARQRLEQRIAGFFIGPVTGSLSQFA